MSHALPVDCVVGGAIFAGLACATALARAGLLAKFAAIADFLAGRSATQQRAIIATYPRFRPKRLLRFAFDRFQADWAFNLALATPPMRWAASQVYFHRRTAVLESLGDARRFEPR